MKKYCYFNGKITTIDKIKISPYDIGLLRGYGVFDVMKTVGENPFLLGGHWKRFQNSAKELGLKIPISKKKYQEIIKKLIKKNGHKKSTIRTVLTGGVSSDAFSFERKETFFILIEKFKLLPSNVYKKGTNIITSEYQRDLPHAKISNYIIAIKNQKLKKQKKALEIIYTQKNRASEATTSNFFIVKNEKLITAKKDILHGITRNLVIELARENGFKVQERDIKINELFSADEIFLTASNKDIVPAVSVDGKKIGKGKVGNVTKELMKLFKDFEKLY